MLTSQQFCVKWNSYSSNLQSVFPRLLNSEHFVDITLACEGQMIKCHKVVLSACSTYFEKLLVQNPCQHPIIFMKDMKHWEVQALVDFMYKGEVNVSQEELNSLLVAAEALQIRGLCGSDTSSNQQDGNKPVLPLSKLPSVTLPNDIVLSGGTSAGQESYQKKRKLSSDEKEQLSTLMPRITGVTSVNTNQTSSDSTATHPTSATDQSKDDGTTEEGDDDMNVSKIKQEMEIEDHFISGEGDIDVQEEDAGNEQQEDSDSNNREDVHSNAHLDQPGPSGIATATNPGEKASTGGRWAGPVSSMVSTEVDHCGLPTLQHLSSVTQSQPLERPFAPSWRGPVAPALKALANQSHFQISGNAGKVVSRVANVDHGQLRVRDCFPSSVQLEGPFRESEAGSSRASLHHYPSPMPSGSSLDQRFDGSVTAGMHSVRPMDVNIMTRSSILEERSRDLLDSGRQSRISRRRTEEEKTLRKLEMARLRQRRFRARMRLMREAGLPVITRGRKRIVISETDNTPS